MQGMYRSKSCNELNRQKPIVIYGAEVWCKIALNALKRHFDMKPVYVIDRVRGGGVIENIDILRFEDLKDPNQYQFLICASRGFKSIKELLISNGVEDIFHISDLFEFADFDILESSYDLLSKDEMKWKYDYYKNLAEGESSSLIIQEMGFSITNCCSLKCKNCVSLIPYYTEKKIFSLDNCKRAITALVDAVDQISSLTIIGGETFIHPEWNEVVDWCVKQDKIKLVNVMTNGTLIPEKDKWSCFGNKKVRVLVDNYGAVSNRCKELIDILEENDIQYVFMKQDYWFDLNDFSDRKYDLEQLKEQFRTCTFSCCYELSGEGMLYRCPHEFAARKQGKFPSKKQEGVDLFHSTNVRKELEQLIYNTDYLEGCNWCNGGSTEKLIAVGEQLM